jgi:hypothetical protein
VIVATAGVDLGIVQTAVEWIGDTTASAGGGAC